MSLRILGNDRPLLLPIAGFTIALSLFACTQDAPVSGEEDEGIPASLTITGAVTAEVGDTTALGAVLKDSHGNPLSHAVTWSTSDSTIIAVSPAGRVRVLAIGTARIVASAASLHDTITFSGTLAPYTFVFADTVPPAERRLILDGIRDAHVFHRLVFEKILTEPVTISGVYDAEGCAGGGSAAFAGGRTITFCLGNPGWRTHGPGIKQKIVQHELFHLWQFAHWSADPAKSPAWLIEGNAEMMGFYGIAQRGLVTFNVALGCQRKESADFANRQPPGLPALSTVETRQAFQNTQGPLYTHSMLAAHFLAEEGDGLASLEVYGNLVKTSATWQTAFEQAFAMTPAEFYADFPGHVAGLAIPATYQCGF